MAIKKYTMRLYRSHDIDLLMLERHGVNLLAAVKIALRAACNGEYFIIKTKPANYCGYVELEPQYVRMLFLDTKEDADIIELLNKVNNGGKNNILKNILRLYLFTPYNSRFLKTKEDGIWMHSFFQRLAETVEVREFPEIYRHMTPRQKKEEKEIISAPKQEEKETEKKPKAEAVKEKLIKEEPQVQDTPLENDEAEVTSAPAPKEEEDTKETAMETNPAGEEEPETEDDIFDAFLSLLPS